MRRLMMGALLAAPLFAQKPAADPLVKDGKLVWFALGESKKEIAAVMGAPKAVMPLTPELDAWDYRIGEGDHDSYSHRFVFSHADGALVSVTRNFEPERPVGEWFPAAGTRVHDYPDSRHPQYRVRVRRIAPDVYLIAEGAEGDSGQVALMRGESLRRFQPWLWDRVKGQ